MIDVDGLSIVTVETITDCFLATQTEDPLGSLQVRKKYSLFRCKKKKKISDIFSLDLLNSKILKTVPSLS